MIFRTTKRDYIAPAIEVLDVACETGFQASAGNVTFDGAIDDGWTNLN